MATTSTDRRFAVLSSSAIKVPCKAATTANITLEGEQTIDGVSCVTDDRVLVKDQTDASENGIYICDSSGWERAPDWDGTYDVKKGTMVYVHSGSANTGFWYVTTADTITIGTTNVSIAGASSVLAVLSAFAQTVMDDADGDAMIETIIDNMTALTAPAIGDLLALSDISSNDGRKITLANLFKVIAGLTALTTPDSANDLILIHDADAAEAKVITPNNLLAAIQTMVVTMNGKALWTAEGADVASAADCNIWSAGDGNTVHVTGTTTITDWGTAPQAGAGMWVIFDGALQLTYNATTNKLNTNSSNYTTVAGDRAYVYAESTSAYVVTLFPLGAFLPIGVLQTWQDVSGSRALDTVYQNTTGRPIEIRIGCSNTNAGVDDWRLYCDTTTNPTTIVARFYNDVSGTYYSTVGCIVPNNSYYKVTNNAGTISISEWVELR